MRFDIRALLRGTFLATLALSAFAVPARATSPDSKPTGNDGASQAQAASQPTPSSEKTAQSPGAGKGQAAVDPAARSEAIIDMLVKGDYAQVHAAFTPKMGALLPEKQLKKVWEDLPAQVGAYKSHGKAAITHQEGYAVASVPLSFADTELVAQISWNDKGEIGGLYFKPAAMQ